ncbi:hypothetical protein B0T16DRAFT_138491 [Cercophora newfieldiana]|uniref:Rhodopsin domain-containing protein n=1 Tax=Cercophora newfieldiana TaxID=92897 RepID=A0AA39YEB3_9PEZI|nr:hypothetical protein B0T16DRAFT_138491 [Cercophora newfieldiana]
MDIEETTGSRIVISLSAVTGISLVMMVLRFFCKAKYSKRFGWDDYLLAASWVCLLIYFGLTAAAVTHGIGRHRALIPPASLVMALRLLYAGRFFAIIASAISKTSFIVTLMPMAKKRWQRNVLWSVMISLNLVLWICGFSLFFECSPIRKAWDISATGTCWGLQTQVNVEVAAGGYSAIMDFALTLLAVILIRHLPMDLKGEKFGVLIALSLGIFAGAAGVVKSYFLAGAIRSTDFTFSSASLLIWSASEPAITIMAASLPSFRPIVQELSQASRPAATTGDTQKRGWSFRTKGKKYETLDDDWITGTSSADGGPRRGRLVMQDGKATVTYL